MENNIVFVYVKNNEVTVLNRTESEINHNNLILKGFQHTATLDSTLWISHILNKNEDDIIIEIKEITGKLTL